MFYHEAEVAEGSARGVEIVVDLDGHRDLDILQVMKHVALRQ
jgi:hypothetical protein